MKAMRYSDPMEDCFFIDVIDSAVEDYFKCLVDPLEVVLVSEELDEEEEERTKYSSFLNSTIPVIMPGNKVEPLQLDAPKEKSQHTLHVRGTPTEAEAIV